MQKNRSFSRKALAVVLAAVMLVASFSLGLVIPSAIAYAGEVRSASDPMGDLTFVVPEAIYLYPNGSSWTAATSSPFQYYINNDANGVPLAAAAGTGKIYYKYAYTYDQVDYGAETAAISYQFVNAAFSPLSGGSVTLSSNTITSGGSVDITAGQSPSLAASANGCYILWTLTLTDAVDGKVKCAYALTYVYKPYVAPVGAMVRTKNQWGGVAYFSYAQQLTWISGTHSITQQTTSTHDGNYYPNYSGEFGMSAFITAGNTAYVGNTAYTAALGLNQDSSWTASASGATKYKMAFINAPSSAAYFNDTDGYDNKAATSWGSESSSSATFNVSSFDYWYKENGLTDHNCLAAVYATPYGNITIDTSRYTDLSQIPNLAVGLMATDNEDGENGNWYVADYSTGSRNLGYNDTKTDTTSDSRESYYNDYTYIIAGQGTNGWSNYGDYESEGVKYAGAWPRTLQNVPAADDPDTSSRYTSSYDYAVKGMFSTEDPGNSSDYCFTHAVIRLSAKQFNKSTLRAAVQRAISKMPSLGVNGISNGSITSCYFDANSNYKWTALQAAFKNAVIGLTTLDNNTNPNDLAKALNKALDELKTKVTIDPNGGSFDTLVTENYVQIGTNQYVQYSPAPGVTYSNPQRLYYNFQNWSGSANSETGLTYVDVGYNNTIYAAWKPVSYTITLLPADDDNVNTETKTVKYNIETLGTMSDIFAAQTTPLENYPAPRQGYSFWYWQVVAAEAGSNWNVNEVFYSADQISGRHGNVTMKAVWAAGMVDVNVYYYEMNKNGSYLNSMNRLVPTDTFLTYGTTNEIITFEPGSREGFTIDQQKSRLTGTPAANGSTILKVFYARNQYNVTFKNYDGSVLQEAKKVYHGAVPTYTGSTPRRAATASVSYTFAGWSDGKRIYNEKDANGTLILPEITQDTVFTAVYSETEALYTVTSAAAEGTVITVDEGTYTYGTEITVSAAALEGYVASGLKLYANGEEIENPSEYTVTGNVEFTTDPLDLPTSYRVTFYDADYVKLSTVSVAEGGDASGMQEAPQREGYTFAQWSLPVNNVTENLTVIAQYNKDGATNYSFNFYQGGKLLATLVREANETFDFPYDILGTPAQSGYDFIGWDPSDFSPAAEDMDVYAQFQPNGYVESYTLTIIYGNGAANGSITKESGSSITVEYPERAGYAFTGWTGDTANIHGTTYTFGEADETITATWYDLTPLNNAEAAIDAILAESDLYRSDYTLRLRALKAEKTDKTGTVPAKAAELDDLLYRMTAAADDAPNYLLYTLYVKVDGETAETLKEIAGASVNITTQPEKDGFAFNGWVLTDGSGAVNGSSFTFAAANAVVEATWVVSNESIAALRAQIDALDRAIYCAEYVDGLVTAITDLETLYLNDPGALEEIAQAIADITGTLAAKEQNKHKFTVPVGPSETNPPTCTAYGYNVYECERCAGRTTEIRVEPLGHDWGEWEVITPCTYGVDGESKRTCTRCGEEETVVTSMNDQSDKAVRFVTMNNMYYMLDVGEGVKITSVTTYRWFSSQELKFKVHIKSGFAFPDYIVYLDGEEITPDGSGYYTVPASANLAVVSIAGVVEDDIPTQQDEPSSSAGKLSFWEWLVNFFRNIGNFFRNLFNR